MAGFFSSGQGSRSVAREHAILTFYNSTISADANGTSFDISEYTNEINILVNVTAITPVDVSGGGSTTLNADAAAETKTFSVADEANFAADDYGYIGTGSTREIVKVKSTSANTLTLYYGTIFAHSNGDAIKECQELTLRPTVETSPDDSVWVHKAVIINEDLVGDLIRLTAPRAEEARIFACGQYQAQLKGNLGKYIRVKQSITTGDSNGTMTVKITGDIKK